MFQTCVDRIRGLWDEPPQDKKTCNTNERSKPGIAGESLSCRHNRWLIVLFGRGLTYRTSAVSLHNRNTESIALLDLSGLLVNPLGLERIPCKLGFLQLQ